MTFNGGDSNQTTQFNALAAGNPTITAPVPVTPAGFSLPAGGANVLTANIAATGLTPANATVGQGLETNIQTQLSGVPSANITVLITSNDTSKLLLATAPGVLGSSCISVQVKAGLNHTPDYYVIATASSGAPTYTVNAPGFGQANGTVTVTPSGIAVSGPSGFGVGISTTSLSSPTNVTVYAAQLDASNNFVTTQLAVSPISVTVSSSQTSVGTITVSPVTIPAGADRTTTSFQPASNGTTVISVSQPLSATPLQNTTVTATVATTGIAATDQVSVGNALEMQGTFALGALAPTGGVTVTITSNSSSLVLSNSATAPGSSVITLQVAAGDFGGESNANGPKYPYWIQSLASSGTATFTVSAPGYVSHTSTVSLTPSGVVVWDGVNVGEVLLASVGSNTPVSVSMAQLDSGNNFSAIQQLAPGHTVTVNVTTTANGTLTPTQVTIQAGTDTAFTQFLALDSTNGSISLVGGAPPGFTLPASGGSLTVFAF